jgi:zinc protease
MSDIEAWKIEDLKRHFETGYSPSNATMVVVGDVSTDEIMRLAEKYIEPIPSHDPPAKVTTVEPPQIGERRVQIKKFAQVPILSIAYHVPQSNDPDFYALQVLRTILFSGESSRMYHRLVDQDQLALDIGGGSGTALDPTLFTITAQAKAGVAPEKLESTIYEELDKVRNGPASDQELQKAKNILLAGFYRQMKTISGKANAIGVYEVFFGDYHKLFTAADEYNKVTTADVQRVAAKYFTERNRTVATLIPDKAPAPAAGGKAGGQ